MAEISRAKLFGKLSPQAYKALEGAAVFCKLRGNPVIELAHWLHQLFLASDCDALLVLRHFEIDQSRLASDLTMTLDRLPGGSATPMVISPHVEEAVERGWVYATLLFDVELVEIAVPQ